jgi:hypothetical protein
MIEGALQSIVRRYSRSRGALSTPSLRVRAPAVGEVALPTLMPVAAQEDEPLPRDALECALEVVFLHKHRALEGDGTRLVQHGGVLGLIVNGIFEVHDGSSPLCFR